MKYPLMASVSIINHNKYNQQGMRGIFVGIPDDAPELWNILPLDVVVDVVVFVFVFFFFFSSSSLIFFMIVVICDSS